MDWGNVSGPIFALAGVVVGAGIPVLVEIIRGHTERKQRIEDRRAEFVRTRLTELLESAQRAQTFLSDYYNDCLREYATYGEWPYSPDEAFGASLTAMESEIFPKLAAPLRTASGLIGDPTIAEQVTELYSAINSCVYAEDYDKTYAVYTDGETAYNNLIARIGEMIRGL